MAEILSSGWQTWWIGWKCEASNWSFRTQLSSVMTRAKEAAKRSAAGCGVAPWDLWILNVNVRFDSPFVKNFKPSSQKWNQWNASLFTRLWMITTDLIAKRCLNFLFKSWSKLFHPKRRPTMYRWTTHRNTHQWTCTRVHRTNANRSLNDRLVASEECDYKDANDRLLKRRQFIMQTEVIGNWAILI